jgi:hypothetical protein
MRFDWDQLYRQATEWAETHEGEPLNEAHEHLPNKFTIGEGPRQFWRLRNESETDAWEQMMSEEETRARQRAWEIEDAGLPDGSKREYLRQRYIARELGRWLRTLRKPEQVFWPDQQGEKSGWSTGVGEPKWYVRRVRDLLDYLNPEGTVEGMCDQVNPSAGNSLRKQIRKRLKSHHDLSGRLTADLFCELVREEARRLGVEVEEVGEVEK